MSSLRAGTVVLFSLILMFQGCGQAPVDRVSATKDPSQEIWSVLESQLSQLRQDLKQQQAQNTELVGRLQAAMEKLAEKERDIARLSEEVRSKTADAKSRSKEDQKADPGRIGLLGAKALAEHKAAELNKRLDVLTKDLNQKEQTLQSITQSAKAKEEEVQRLSKRVEELQAENESRTGDLNKRMLQLTKDLNESSTAAKQFKQELKEKEELLTALKIAVTDAGRLKETAEKENERLGKALADTTQQLAASREDAEQQRRLVAQLTGQLEQTHQNAVAWHQEAQRLSNEVQQLAGQMESLKQESENLKNQISQAGSVAVTSQQEAEQYRVEGEGFRQEAVKLRVELKRAQDEVAQLKALASDLGTRLQQLQASAATAEHEGPSYVDRIIGAVTRSQRDQEGPKPAPPQAVGTTQQDTTQEDAEQPYEAPSFEDLGSGIGLPPGSQVTPPSSRPTRHKADNDKVAGQRPAPARPRPAASTLY